MHLQARVFTGLPAHGGSLGPSPQCVEPAEAHRASVGPSSLSCQPALRAPVVEAARPPEQRGSSRAQEAGPEQGWAGSPLCLSAHPARAGASDPSTAWPRRAWHTCVYTCVCVLVRVCPAAPADSLRAGIWTSPSPQASPSPGQGPPLALQPLSQPSSQTSPQRWADPGPVDLWGQEEEAQMDRDTVCHSRGAPSGSRRPPCVLWL